MRGLCHGSVSFDSFIIGSIGVRGNHFKKRQYGHCPMFVSSFLHGLQFLPVEVLDHICVGDGSIECFFSQSDTDSAMEDKPGSKISLRAIFDEQAQWVLRAGDEDMTHLA